MKGGEQGEWLRGEGMLHLRQGAQGWVRWRGERIAIADAGGASPWDLVEVAYRREGGGLEGRVVRVMARFAERVAAAVTAAAWEGTAQVAPVFLSRGRERRLSDPQGRLSRGDLVVAREDGEGGLLRLERRIGPATAFSCHLELLAHSCAVASFPREVLAEARDLARDLPKGPVPRGTADLRRLPFVTIDGPSSKDFDDAVCAWGRKVFVAVADVGRYVKPGSRTDLEARRRAFSLYLPEKVHPMLPPELSNGCCSLIPGAPRYALVWELGPEPQCRRAVIQSRRRLTYDEVERAICGGHNLPPWLSAMIFELHRAASLLHQGRRERGALELGLERYEVLLRDGRPAALVPVPRLRAQLLIEELMVAAGEAAADALGPDGGILWREHARPQAQEVARLAQMAGGDPAAGMPELLRALEEAGGDGGAWQEALLHILPAASYSTLPLPHFGLALERYCQCTSPIRRYPDLLVQRALNGEPSPADLEEIRGGVNLQERRYALAERVALRVAGAHLAGRAIGKVQRASVLDVRGCGMGVRSLTGHFDLWVPFGEELRGDPETGEVVRRGRPLCRIGDVVRVQVLRTDPATGEIEARPVLGA